MDNNTILFSSQIHNGKHAVYSKKLIIIIFNLTYPRKCKNEKFTSLGTFNDPIRLRRNFSGEYQMKIILR